MRNIISMQCRKPSTTAFKELVPIPYHSPQRAHDPHKCLSGQVHPNPVTTISLRSNLSLSILDFPDAYYAFVTISSGPRLTELCVFPQDCLVSRFINCSKEPWVSFHSNKMLTLSKKGKILRYRHILEIPWVQVQTTAIKQVQL